jgi:hypothetical protein
MTTIYNDEIKTWDQLFSEITYSWDYLHSRFIKCKDGHYNLNKLDITPTEVTYKMDIWKLNPDVYQKFLKFVELFEE